MTSASFRGDDLAMPKGDDENRTERIAVRITPSLKARLEKLADAEHRTLSSYIELALARIADEAAKKR